MTAPSDSCRCGHAGDGPHPCHAKGYRCGAPATQRFYNAQRVALAGMQPKLQVQETWACDACWESYKAALKEAR
jgi:hypothetical protein